MSKILFPLLPTPIEALKTLRSYFRHSAAAQHAYAVFEGKKLRYWSTTKAGAENWAGRMLWNAYTVELVGRDLTVRALPTDAISRPDFSWMSSSLVKAKHRVRVGGRREATESRK